MAEPEERPVPHELLSIGGDDEHPDRPRWGAAEPQPYADDEDDFVAVFLDDAAEPDQQPLASAPLVDWLRRLEASRYLLAAGLVCSLIALNLAVVGWATRPEEAGAEAQTAVGAHGLTPDQAACFAFARIENRIAVSLPDVQVQSRPLNRALRLELLELDAIAADNPEADYRLIVAFGALGDRSAEMLDADVVIGFGAETGDRFSALSAARESCIEIAGFDTETSSVVDLN